MTEGKRERSCKDSRSNGQKREKSMSGGEEERMMIMHESLTDNTG